MSCTHPSWIAFIPPCKLDNENTGHKGDLQQVSEGLQTRTSKSANDQASLEQEQK